MDQMLLQYLMNTFYNTKICVHIFPVVDPCVTAACSHSCKPQTSDSYQCGCPAGFTLGDDEHTCNNSNECDEGMCDQVCTDTVGSYICSCRAGYRVINIFHCEDIDECLVNNDCHQTCTNAVGSYTCMSQEENTTSKHGK